MNRPSVKHMFSGILLCSLILPPVAIAEPLYGGVKMDEPLLQSGRKSEALREPKYSAAQPAPKCDCIPFNPQSVEAKEIEGRWTLVDGDHWMKHFGPDRDTALKSVSLVSLYRMNQICYFGRDLGRPATFFLSDGQAPEGKIDGEVSIAFAPEEVRAEQIDGNWKVTSGSLCLEDFGDSRGSAQEASDAAERIKYFGFRRKCSIGTADHPLRYYAK